MSWFDTIVWQVVAINSAARDISADVTLWAVDSDPATEVTIFVADATTVVLAAQYEFAAVV